MLFPIGVGIPNNIGIPSTIGIPIGIFKEVHEARMCCHCIVKQVCEKTAYNRSQAYLSRRLEPVW